MNKNNRKRLDSEAGQGERDDAAAPCLARLKVVRGARKEKGREERERGSREKEEKERALRPFSPSPALSFFTAAGLKRSEGTHSALTV